MTVAERLPALGHRHFRNWILGAFLSNLGGQLQTWAIFWHLDHLTHQPIAVGIVGLVRVVPLLLFGLFGGVVADQRDRRQVLLVTQCAMALTALVLTALTLSGHIGPFSIYLLVAVAAIAQAYNGPVQQATTANLVPPEHFPNAASINGIQWRLSEILGPALSGLLIWAFGAFYGPAVCYGLNAVSFGALMLAIATLPSMPPKVARSRGAREVTASIGEGIAFLRRTYVISNAMWIDFWGTFLAGATALLPAFSRSILHLGPDGYGLLAASGGVGAMLASAALAWIPTVRRQGALVISMIAVFGAFTILLGVSGAFWAAALCYAGIGASDMISTVMRQTIRQLAIPDEMRGRLSAIGMIFQVSGPQLGDFEAAQVAQIAGIRTSLILGGVGAFFVAGWYHLRGPALRDYEHQAPLPQEA